MTLLSDNMSAVIEPEPIDDFKDVMIDIETLSLHKHKALILSIGMIEFDPRPQTGMVVGNRSLIIPAFVPQLLLGRQVSVSTQEFWAKQKPEASRHWMENFGGGTDLKAVCHAVRNFCAGKDRVWANGTQFDLCNLEGLADDVGEKDLWHYQAPRDMRTFVRETEATRLIGVGDALDIPGVAHEPVYDCITQAWQVWSHWRDH
jgi:hypothetical protein